MPRASLDSISVVLVTHDSMPLLADCLARLRPELARLDAELIVVDNASRDGSPAHVRATCPGANLVRNAANRGFAHASNQGARLAHGELLAFLNPDVCIDPGALDALARALADEPTSGLVAARLRSPDGDFQPSCRRFPAPSNLWQARGSVLARRQSSGDTYTLPDADRTVPVPAVAAAFVMVRRALFEQVGGFDERFFVYMEDTDLSLRLTAAGHPCRFVPAAGAVHAWGRGSSAGRMARARHHHVSMWKYFRKHHPGAFTFGVLPGLLAANLLATAVLGRRRDARTQASGGTSSMASRSGPTDTKLTGTPASDSIART